MNEVIKQLNQLLADSKVFYQNLHNFHWNIKGEFFFELHAKLGELYDTVGADTDVFAERILALGGTPVSTYSEYLQMSGIKEVKATTDYMIIMTNVLESLRKTVNQLNATRKAAVAADDEGTNTLMGDKILCVEKQIWMILSFLNKSTKSADKSFGKSLSDMIG